MTLNRVLFCLLMTASAATQAQSSAPASAPPATAAKKELLQRMMALQQPSLEGLARDLTERPARQMIGQADTVLQARVPADKRQAVGAQIQTAVRKYLDESVPIVTDRAGKIGQSSLLPMIDEKFTEDELRQLLAALDNPAYKKFQQALPELSNSFAQKLVADVQPTIDPKVKALDQSITSAITTALATAPEPKAAKPAASSASRPAKK